MKTPTKALEGYLPVLLLLSMGLMLAACDAPDEDSGDYVDTMAEVHEGDRPAASPLTEAPRHAVDTMRVTYGEAGGTTLTGYLARPARPDSIAEAMGMDTSGALPGVVVVHEWWGLNENIEAMARRLAGEGYVALAVDLYDDQVAEQPSQAQQYMREATGNYTQIISNVEQGVQYLEQNGSQRIGIIGWCLGGSVVMNSVIQLDHMLEAAVIYYGQPVTNREQLADVETPIRGFFGGQDESIPVDSVRAFRSILEETSSESAVDIYPEAGHAFANPSGQNYVPEAASHAWQQTLSFLEEQLQDV